MPELPPLLGDAADREAGLATRAGDAGVVVGDAGNADSAVALLGLSTSPLQKKPTNVGVHLDLVV